MGKKLSRIVHKHYELLYPITLVFTGFLQRKKRYIKNKKRYVSVKYRQRNVNRKQTGIALCDFDLPDAVGSGDQLGRSVLSKDRSFFIGRATEYSE